MFDGIKRIWKGIMRMFERTTLKSIVGKDIAMSSAMINAINEWQQMLNGKADWTSNIVESLEIEAGICREFADAAIVEMETGVTNSRLDKVYQEAVADLNENLQDGIGLGSLVLRPLGADKYEYVSADKFVIIEFSDEGKPLDIGFIAVKQAGGSSYYTKFERHYFVNGNLTIENKCFRSQSSNMLGSPCEFSEVEEWKDVNPGPVTFVGMSQMDFGYYRNPIKNKVDGSKCGVSAFESAKGRIKKADIQGARLDWEYESGERAIHVDDRALRKGNNGRTGMGKLNERLYRGLNLDDGKDKELLKEYSPEMRDESYIKGLEEYKREIEFDVGLAYGDLSKVSEVEKTAEEVKASKIRKYNRVDAIQKKLRTCLEDFVAGLSFYNGLYTSGYEFKCNFHDSILTDEEKEREQDRSDVAIGAMPLWEYRAKWYSEDEKTAKEAVGTPAEVIE